MNVVKLTRASGGSTVVIDRTSGQHFPLGERIDGVSDAAVKRLQALQGCEFDVQPEKATTSRKGGKTAEGGETNAS